MENVENYGLESAHRRRPSIRVVISKSNIYGSAHTTMQVPPIVKSMNPDIAADDDMWSADGPVGLAAMGIDSPRASQDDDNSAQLLLGNRVEVETTKGQRAKGLWAKLKSKFKRGKSPGPHHHHQHPWQRVVGGGGFGGILVGRETKVETEDKPGGGGGGLPKSKTTADFRRPPRPISTNWKAAHDSLLDMGDERDKKPETATEKIGGLVRSMSAVLPGRH